MCYQCEIFGITYVKYVQTALKKKIWIISMILYRIVLIIDDSPQFMSIKIIATLCKTGDVFLSTI